MKKEKNMLQDTFSAGEYLAPSVKVKEFRHRSVICASGGETVSMTFGEERDNDDFE